MFRSQRGRERSRSQKVVTGETLSKSTESSDVPKPKRERKKSKSKGGDGGDVATIAALSAKEEAGNEKVSEKGDVAGSELVNNVTVSPGNGEGIVPGGAEKLPEKSKTAEKGKKSPSKKSPAKGGQETSEK